MSSTSLRIVFLGLAALAVPCLGLGLGCSEPEEPVTYDPDEVVADAITFASEYDRLDLQPIASVHGDGTGFAEIYANDVAAEVFRGIDGSDPSDTAEFPRGSILVKNNLDANMQPIGVLTILAKFEDGYNPEGDDWFFAMVDTEGTALNETIGNGAEVYYCYDCHSQMGPNTDLIIGLQPGELR